MHLLKANMTPRTQVMWNLKTSFTLVELTPAIPFLVNLLEHFYSNENL